MKIIRLEIKGYKNLKQNTVFDFSNCTNFVTLIGLNGSGKSNVLEAVSIIFASLYTNKPTGSWNNGLNFEYKIVYSISTNIIEIVNGTYKLLYENDIEINRNITRNKKDFLPSEIIACYSGDELRLWQDIYSSFYFSYLAKISKGFKYTKQNLLYVNKYAWEFALLSLVCHQDSQQYIKELLQVDDLTKINIRFSFPSNYEKRKEWFLRYVEIGTISNNEIIDLVQRIKDEQERSSSLIYPQISSMEIGVIGNLKFCRKLFYLLFAAGMPKEQKLFTKISIEFNNLTLKSLSEGEKKIILIKCLSEILANEKSLILLDEPDAHIHIGRKKEIIDIIDSDKHTTLLTTHSPTILHCVKNENIRIVRNATDDGVEVIQLDKMKALAAITNNEFSFIDATLAISSSKPLLLVEGKGDVAYINKAISVLRQQSKLDIDILPFGGTGNAKDFINEILKCVTRNKTIIVLFDRDDAGAGTEKGGMKSCINFPKGKMNLETYKKDNCIFLMLPKTPEHTENDFLIEDYFSINKKNELATKYITNAKGAFNNFPKDLKEKIKGDLSSDIASYDEEDLSGFQVLLDKLINIIQGTEAFKNEIVSLPHA